MSEVDADGAHPGRERQLEAEIARLRGVEQERERLLAMLGQSQTMVCDWQGRIEVWSQGMERLFGYRAAEAVGAIAWELLRSTYPVPWADIVEALRREERWVGEVWHRAKDGSSRIVQATWLVQPAQDGVPSSLVVAKEDQTAVKQAETALRASEARFRAMADTAPVLIWELDVSGVVFVNGHYLDFFGVGFEDVCGLGWARFLHPDDAEAYVAAYRAAFDERRPYACEARFRRADGQYRWLRNSGGPLGERGFVGCSLDVTNIQEAQLSLRASEARFRGFADNSLDVLWIADDSGGKLEYLSPAFERVFGEPRDRITADLGRWRALLHPEDGAPGGLAARALAGEVAIAHYRVVRPADGQMVYLRDTAFPIRDAASGTITQVAGIMQDITDLARGRDELEALVAARTKELMVAEASLRQSQKMEAVGQLAGGIAHDFNNMLQGIASSLELMHRRAEQGRLAEAGRYVESAQETVRRAAALTHRLLAFSRQQTLAPASVNLDDSVRGLEELVRRTVGSAVQVEVRLGDGTWPVLCDESQLENVLLNLCANARDAMPGGGWLTISTGEVQLSAADLAGEEATASGPFATLAVTDTGSGMDEATRARVFEPFFTTKPLGQGTGLGLSQVYGFVRQSGGLVRIESTLGEGTTVRLFLPRYAAPAEGGQDVAEPASAVILLVEDEEGLRTMAAEWLREAGRRVLEAPDGAAALRLLQGGGQVDALVTDVGLPGNLNGRQVADAARELRPELPVLFITGYAGTALRTALPEGMAVIDKPFALEDLAERVGAMLDAVRADG